LYYARLTGHGRDGAAMADASVASWAQDGVEALAIGRKLGDKVVVVATSTGATLATWLLANGYGNDVAAAIMVSPNFRPHDPMSEMLLWPWGEQIARVVVGPNFRWTPINDRHRRYWTTEFPVAALLPMMGMVEVARRSDLGRVRAPVLVFYSTQDHIVDSSATERQFARFGSSQKRLVRIDHAEDPQQHVLAGDILSPNMTDEVVRRTHEFLREAGVVSGR
jgi:alpha-beta hydrolase superfamily lysophospholipase